MKILHLLAVLLVVGVMVSNNPVAGVCQMPDCYKCVRYKGDIICAFCVGDRATECDSTCEGCPPS
ncbi:hypothetical protein HOLleu_36017 [Holothuria leucospilota]|uniref:Uncharacterized protein n=1 Tax=Holothuria leucospilota TaxID=206669 RepID=A0A9Q0YLJ8_HOLLE|nr:hypothetical protein HOLleu_36017 [Holothuria leucospilota]